MIFTLLHNINSIFKPVTNDDSQTFVLTGGALLVSVVVGVEIVVFGISMTPLP